MKINDLFNVAGKTAVVTGGSRGIGEMITAGLLANGVKVYITARKVGPLIAKAEELSELYNGECIALGCDLSSMEGVENFANQIKEREDSIDFLINNAGAAWAEPFDTFSETGWDKVMDLNVKSLFFLTQKMKPLLASNASLEDPSRVINIGSIDGLNIPMFETFSYSTSKAAVHHLTRHLAKRLVSENILVNAIAPGPYPSNMLGAAVAHDYSEIAVRNPRKRVGTPEDIAGLVIFLCSRAGAYTVGETIASDGGLVKTSGHNLG
ncbi:MAG: SDR family oxidoreductase [SAR86 cluster bacterium]|nr:SDR family oxidoreductase [SAR86 cluster bacterium]|tara:strand:- start:2768 stop:3565 length:798 start_codon:yes stop_codon:yes gene_type:complete